MESTYLRNDSYKPNGPMEIIPAKEREDLNSLNRIYRTCAYCRVSTDSEMQQSSFELQKQHYEQLASSHPNWQLQHIYADEGISGTSVKHRKEFNSMIEACKGGKFDLILTKSVSRFARNLVDCIAMVRMLKSQTPPVGVFFETDNLFTLSEDSELKLAILSTVAQGESEKKSESMNWSLKERFRNGRLLMPEPYGYSRQRDPIGRYVKDAPLVTVESEAKVVHFIFDAFLAEYSMDTIADILNELEIPTKTGSKWRTSTIKYILGNERYCGNVVTWKTFTADVFGHTKKKNTNNEREQCRYTDRHEAIIPTEKYEAVQKLLSNLTEGIKGFSPTHVIDNGIFTGYVPINHKWKNKNPNVYYEASNSLQTRQQEQDVEKSSFSIFNLDGFQVVRGHFLTARHECPCMTVGNGRLSFNTVCMKKFSGVQYIQLLIHPSERKLAIRPCSAYDMHRIKWRLDRTKPILCKLVAAPYFTSALYQIMEWNPDYQYHIRGTWLNKGPDEIIIFDLSNSMSSTYVNCDDDEKKRVLLCPDEWNDSFGEEFYDFCIQNSIYYIRSGNWNTNAKGLAVYQKPDINIPSKDDLLAEIKELKVGMNDEQRSI